MKSLTILLTLAASARAYWLMGIENFITTERIDPIVNPGKIAGHVHSVLGGSNFRFNTNTEALRQSQCTSIPIPEDKSNYWFPHLYFQWANGSFTSVGGGAVIYYLFNDKPGTTTAFPDDFRMLSGDPMLRTYDAASSAQRAVDFLCLDFNGVTTKHTSLPKKSCPSGIRSQINFPSCWDGKSLDSPDHKSHVAFLSGGPDSGTCKDPKYPVTLPRIFIEVYWGVNDFEKYRSQAKDTAQPFVFSNGDPTGYGYHADFLNGWDKGVLQNAVDKCHCNIYGDPTCCADQGIFHLTKGKKCHITRSINEATTGTLPKLPGNNPVQPEGQRATAMVDTSNPQLVSPVYVYTGDNPTQTGTVVPGGNPPVPTVGPSPPVVSSAAPSATKPVVVPSPPVVSSAAPSATTPVVVPSAPPPVTVPGTTAPHVTTSKYTIPSISIPSISIPSITIPSIPKPAIPQVTVGGTSAGGNGGAPPAKYPTGTAPAQHVPATTKSAQSGSLPTSVPRPAQHSPGQCRPKNKSKRPSRYRRTTSDEEEVPAATPDLDRTRRSRMHRRVTNYHVNGIGAFHLW